MEVVLHIGTDKTGSTSIQSMLSINREWLAGRSIFIPLTGFGEGNGHSVLLSDSDPDAYEALGAELKHARENGYQRAVLSWEGMSARRFGRTAIRRLLAVLEDAKVHILVYLREQAEVIQSGHMQKIKQHQNIGDIRSLVQPRTVTQRLLSYILLRNPNRNYYRLLRRWERNLPDATFSVRIFTRQKLYQGDVVSDFLSQLEVAPDTNFTSVQEDYNPSLDVAGALMLESLQKDFPEEQMDILVDIAQSVAAVEGRSTRYFLDEAAVTRIRRHFKRSNSRVARRFMPGEPTLFQVLNRCWREEPLEALEAQSSTLAALVEKVGRIPTLQSASVGADIARLVDQSHGWSSPGPSCIWSVGRESRLRFRLFRRRLPPDTDAIRLLLKGRYYGHNQRTRVRVNELDLGEHDLSLNNAALLIPRTALARYEMLDILLTHIMPISPLELEGKPDRRALAFGLEKVAYTAIKDR